MSKEKLTVDKTIININNAFRTALTSQYGFDRAKFEMGLFLTQIRDEIISSDYHYNISQRTIEEIFNKYLTEEGGN